MRSIANSKHHNTSLLLLLLCCRSGSYIYCCIIIPVSFPRYRSDFNNHSRHPACTLNHLTSWVWKSANAINWNSNSFQRFPSLLLGFHHKKHLMPPSFADFQSGGASFFPGQSTARSDYSHALQLSQMLMQRAHSLLFWLAFVHSWCSLWSHPCSISAINFLLSGTWFSVKTV